MKRRIVYYEREVLPTESRKKDIQGFLCVIGENSKADAVFVHISKDSF